VSTVGKMDVLTIYIQNPVRETCATTKQLQSSIIGMERHQRQLEFIDGPSIFGAAADVEAFGNLVEMRIWPGEEAAVTDDGQSIGASGGNDAGETDDE
jgi:hypothetical protein